MKASSLFLLPSIAAAASPLATLRGGGVGGAKMATARSLAAVSGINGAYMALASEQAYAKLYRLSKKEEDATPTVMRLVQNNGMSAISLAMTSILLACSTGDTSTSIKPATAIAAGLVPRLLVLLHHYTAGGPVRISLDGLVAGYVFQIACATSLVANKWIPTTMAMKIMAFFYLSAGVGISLSPKTLSRHLLQMADATDVEQRCLLAQGKTDFINGALCWALAVGKDITQALGLSCLAWIAAVIWSDFFVQGLYNDPAAIVQLLIPIVCAWILL